MKPYKLMATLFAHTGDVKGLCATRDKAGFVSVSRDLTGKLWQCLNENSNQYVQAQTITVHKKYVNSVVVVYTLEEYPNGLILTGSNDKTIAIHDIESNKTVAVLEEHDGSVCALNFSNESKTNLLYSGSFDSTAKVWNLNELVRSDFKLKSSITIKGHEQTVWSVLGVEAQGVLLTASADKSIRHWQLSADKTSAQFITKYTGHADCVRGLALSNANPNEFFSCSNDGCVMQWKLAQSSPLRTIRVTDSFLYCVNMIHSVSADPKTCYFITSGEDRSLRVHSANESGAQTIQTLALPSQSLWYTISLPNGNLVVACSDGSIRLFTNNEHQMASKSEQEEYERELAQFAIPLKTNQAMAQINRTELPGIEALANPGRRDGQTLMINNENEAEVYQWDETDSRWVKIGVAVGSSDAAGGQTKKTMYLGKEYDYVFDIELDEGGAKLKLPFNLSEDPYHAAQKFIHKHELSQMFLDQIAQFLITNTQGETIGASGTASQYFDPFTGGGRYVPPTSNSYGGGLGSSTVADPLTGSGAYHSGSGGYQPPAYSSPAVDPFTGSGAYHSGGNKPPSHSEPTKPLIQINTPNQNEFYPITTFISFDQKNFTPILKKLRELQSQISADHKNELISDKSNIELIENLLENLDKLDVPNIHKDQIELLFYMLDAWPLEHVFPLIDILRIVVLNPDVTSYLCKYQNTSYLSNLQAQPNTNNYFKTIFNFINQDYPVNTMLALRVISNLFSSLNNPKENQKLTALMLNERLFLLGKLAGLFSTENKSVQIALSTVLLNYAVLVNKMANFNDKFSSSCLTELGKEFVEYLSSPELCECITNWDNEAIFRVLVCVGTVLSDSNPHVDTAYLVSVVKSLGAVGKVCGEIASKADKYLDKVRKCNGHLVKLV